MELSFKLTPKKAGRSSFRVASTFPYTLTVVPLNECDEKLDLDPVLKSRGTFTPFQLDPCDNTNTFLMGMHLMFKFPETFTPFELRPEHMPKMTESINETPLKKLRRESSPKKTESIAKTPLKKLRRESSLTTEPVTKMAAKKTRRDSNFVIEPIGDKPVTELLGVGEKAGRRLSMEGYDTASTVLGQFLVLKRDQNLFETWFRSVTDSTTFHARQCYNCLDEYSVHYIN